MMLKSLKKRLNSFATKLFISLIIFFIIISLLLVSYFSKRFEELLYQQIGKYALVQAKEIAIIPNLISAVEQRDTKGINQFVSRLYANSDASFIVIGDAKGNHLFHTGNIQLYSPMMGGDNDAVLRGESIISIRKGTLGVSLRGKTPIINKNGQVVGIVSVGYLQHDIHLIYSEEFTPIIIIFICLTVSVFAFSWFFSRRIKSQMLGLEPKEICRLAIQQEAILESIFEGVIAIDINYRITAINYAARSILGIKQSASMLTGVDLSSIIQTTNFLGTDSKTTDCKDEICQFNNIAVIASRTRIIINNQLQGWVISFRDKNDINSLNLQLSQVKHFADNLRVMRHESLNWMAMLAGLLHMKEYDKAISILEAKSLGSQRILDFVSSRFQNHAICGLLLGKYSRANELGLQLELDPACQLKEIPATLTEVMLISIIGNLLDNAFDAIMNLKEPQLISEHNRIELYISDETNELVIEVADQGVGIDPTIRDHLFERGITSKASDDHGIGLYLVSSYVQQAGGLITISDGDEGGAIFSIFIPK